MTIKEFASLCGCSTQTLRYYDKIGLLKPMEVAPWSGYRYYSKQQSIDFVKIKNLQAADFTIEEIKELLTMSDKQVYEAFTEDWATEPGTGPAVIEKLKVYIEQSLREDLTAEPEVEMVLNDRVIRGTDNIADTFESLKGKGYEDTVLIGDKDVASEEALTPENSESIWSKHGWNFVYEFIREIPRLEDGLNYFTLLRRKKKEKPS